MSTSSGSRAAGCCPDTADGGEPLGSIGDGAVHVLPVLEPGLQEPTAHLHLTANPRRPWDAQLQTYAQLCAAHVAMALSGLRRLQDERHRAEVLTALDTAKSDFFANVSHELRTPLTLIAGPVQDALTNPDLGEEARERFELIRRNTDRLVGLVDRILDLTRVEAGAVEAHWVRADVADLVRGLAANFRPAIERLGLDFDVELDDLGRETFVDVDMLERIVLNLLSNALKFTPRGRIVLRLAGSRRRLRDLRERHRHRHRGARPRARLRPLPPAEPHRRAAVEGGRGHRSVARPAARRA